MAALAREHWREENPRVYRKMLRRGDLEGESMAAAKLTMREMNALMWVKMTEQEAWQASRYLFIYKTAEQIAKSYNPQ
jgi:hypothetical protein